jgi:hypothetical protein
MLHAPIRTDNDMNPTEYTSDHGGTTSARDASTGPLQRGQTVGRQLVTAADPPVDHLFVHDVDQILAGKPVDGRVQAAGGEPYPTAGQLPGALDDRVSVQRLVPSTRNFSAPATRATTTHTARPARTPPSNSTTPG